ncbi:MAG TPA: hypothetical protein VF223_08115 [Trebonia sp.]
MSCSAHPGGRPPQTPPRPRLSARWRKPPSYRALGAALGLCGLALAAGCSVAPAGATANSPAIGPVRTGDAAKNFPPFPVPAVWNGQNDMPYQMVAKSKAGTAPRKFSFIVKQSMVFWLNCIGTGTARLASPAIGLAWGIPCGNGADPAGITFIPPHAAQGKLAKLLVTASTGSRWEVRVDEPAPAGAAG